MATQINTPTADTRREERRVLAGTLVGTTIEWYDFFIYAQAAGLVLAPLFFSALAEAGGAWAQLAAWASLGVSFLFRPLGAIIAGRLGDRIGRKSVLVMTLILMGAATALIGVLPTAATIGIAAPILLIVLRILQGLSAGGEWGGAVLMAVEHAPARRRGYFGAYPQIGVPAGMVLATATMFIVTSLTTDEQFMEWGWRVTFLLSVLLIVVGFVIRRAIGESPVFEEMSRRKQRAAAPLTELFRTQWRNVIKAALSHVGSNASGYLFIAFFSSYAIRVHGMEQGPVLLASAVAGLIWLTATLWSGVISDRIGRPRALIIGYVIMFVWMIPLFLLLDTASIGLYTLAIIVFTIGNGLTYGPLSAMFVEMFPAQIRYSGIAISYALAAVLGGAFAPLIAEWLLGATGTSISIAIYVMVLFIISALATLTIRDRRGVNLGVQQDQS